MKDVRDDCEGTRTSYLQSSAFDQADITTRRHDAQPLAIVHGETRRHRVRTNLSQSVSVVDHITVSINSASLLTWSPTFMNP